MTVQPAPAVQPVLAPPMRMRLTRSTFLTAEDVPLRNDVWLLLCFRGSAVGLPLKSWSPASPVSGSRLPEAPPALFVLPVLATMISSDCQLRCLSGTGWSIASA